MTQEQKTSYIIYCIDKFADAFRLTSKQSFAYLNRYKGIEFLENNYEAEHLLSFEDAIEDLTAICQRNGGGIV